MEKSINHFGSSPNMVAENQKALKRIFPEAFTGGGLNFGVLRELLGDVVIQDEEKYGLFWHGKKKARQIALEPAIGTLRPCKQESDNWDTTQNLFIEGDNLEVLKILQKSYANKVKMIYIDPPYNTGKEFIYPDKFQDTLDAYLRSTGRKDDEGYKVSSNTESSGRYHTNWLNMMLPRLKLARGLLKDDGVIFISIDENEAYNLMGICNEIFGEENYIGEIIWQKRKGGGNDSQFIAVDHEKVFIFCKSIHNQKKKWRVPYAREYLKRYREKDDMGRFYWDTLHRGGLQSPIIYDVECPDGSIIKNGKWQVSKKSFIEKKAHGNIRIVKSSNCSWTVQHKVYQPEGRVFRSIYSDVTNTNSANELKDIFKVNKVFDNPKPSKLISTLINLCGAKTHDIILDFFAGSATTAHATIDLNKADGGDRKFIMVQLPEPCDEKSEAYKAGYKTIAELGKERIRRAAAIIRKENPDYAGDLGFRVFKLDSSKEP